VLDLAWPDVTQEDRAWRQHHFLRHLKIFLMKNPIGSSFKKTTVLQAFVPPGTNVIKLTQ
jgi:hypothetical protein